MAADENIVASEKKDIKRGASQILSGFGVRIVARILLLSFVARAYGVSDFGRLGETVAVVELLAAFATFGLSKTLLGEMGAEKVPGRMAPRVLEAIVLVLLISTVLTAVLWLAWPYLAAKGLKGSQFVLLGIPLIALAEVATTATRHFRTVFWDTVIKAFIKPWGFLILAIAAFYGVIGKTTITGDVISSEQALLGAYVGSLLLAAIVALLMLGRFFRDQDRLLSYRPTLSGVLQLARRSWHIALNETGVAAFRRVDIILLAAVAGPTATGIYYLAQQIGTIVEKVRYLFEPILAPIIAQSPSLDTISAHLRRLVALIFVVQSCMIVIAMVVGPAILEWFDMVYVLGIYVILAILVGEMMDGSVGLCELPMVYRHPAWPPRLVGIALAIEIVSVWFLAEKYAALGAAIGFAIAMTSLAAMRLILVRKLYGFKLSGPIVK